MLLPTDGSGKNDLLHDQPAGIVRIIVSVLKPSRPGFGFRPVDIFSENVETHGESRTAETVKDVQRYLKMDVAALSFYDNLRVIDKVAR